MSSKYWFGDTLTWLKSSCQQEQQQQQQQQQQQEAEEEVSRSILRTCYRNSVATQVKNEEVHGETDRQFE